MDGVTGRGTERVDGVTGRGTGRVDGRGLGPWDGKGGRGLGRWDGKTDRVVAGEEGGEGGQVRTEAVNVDVEDVAVDLILVLGAGRVRVDARRLRALGLEIGRLGDVDEVLVGADQLEDLEQLRTRGKGQPQI